jgi:hypothetical protein
MCVFFDPNVPKQCREDDAEEVLNKERANFCEWYEASPSAFSAGRMDQAARAKSAVDALFDEGQGESPEQDGHHGAADDLFK